MRRSIVALMVFSALATSACALDTDGAGELAASASGGGASRVIDGAAGVPDFVDHDASTGGGSAVLVGAGAGSQDGAVAALPDAAPITDSSPPLGPPKPGSDDKKEAGKE